MKTIYTGLLSVLTVTLLITGCETIKNPSSENTEASEAPKRRPATTTPTTSPALARGIRLDPAYFYNSHPGQSVTQIALDVVTTVKAAGGNQLYLYAYNTIYGAWYPTQYAQTTTEAGYGKLNIFNAVTAEAKKQGLKVVAVVPLNNFKSVWDNNSSWRVKKAGNIDYVPFSGIYLLSASVLDYQNWYKGFIDDLVARNPNIDAIEVVEPTLDYNWDKVADQNPAALAAFSSKYPSALVGSQSWLDFRAAEFLNLIALFNQQVHKNLKQSYLVQTWTIQSNGSLMPNSTIKNSSGFDFVGVATLQNESKTDNLVTELIWQQWFSQYGTSVFNPSWISTIGASYKNTLTAAGANSNLHIHVEISTFSGAYNTTSPTDLEFQQTLQSAKSVGLGISVYDYNQVKTRNAFSYLSSWQ